jgi:hypothetical protein
MTKNLDTNEKYKSFYFSVQPKIKYENLQFWNAIKNIYEQLKIK